MRAAPCEAAWAAARCTDGYLPAQYRHLLRTFGKKGHTRAVFAVGHSFLIIAWHLLASKRRLRRPPIRALHPRNADAEARKRYLVRQLQALGHKVTVEPAAGA